MYDQNIIQKKIDEYRHQAEALMTKVDLLVEILHDIESTNPQQVYQPSAIPAKQEKRNTTFGGKKPAAQSVKIQKATVKLLADGVPRTLSAILHTLERELQIKKIPPSTLRYIIKREPRIIKLEGEGYQIINNEGAEASSD